MHCVSIYNKSAYKLSPKISQYLAESNLNSQETKSIPEINHINIKLFKNHLKQEEEEEKRMSAALKRLYCSSSPPRHYLALASTASFTPTQSSSSNSNRRSQTLPHNRTNFRYHQFSFDGTIPACFAIYSSLTTVASLRLHQISTKRRPNPQTNLQSTLFFLQTSYLQSSTSHRGLVSSPISVPPFISHGNHFKISPNLFF